MENPSVHRVCMRSQNSSIVSSRRCKLAETLQSFNDFDYECVTVDLVHASTSLFPLFLHSVSQRYVFCAVQPERVRTCKPAQYFPCRGLEEGEMTKCCIFLAIGLFARSPYAWSEEATYQSKSAAHIRWLLDDRLLSSLARHPHQNEAPQLVC